MKGEKKLIIWDFDGVIADSEYLWIQNWQNLLNQKFNLNWDFQTANKYLGGISPKSKMENLKQFNISINEEFLIELKNLDWYAVENLMTPMKDVEEVFKLNFTQCIATGGNFDKTEHKLKMLDFEKYFQTKNIFTSQMVLQGKPEPDLFLLAAKSMNFETKNCIVIEDSIAGLIAGIKAGMQVVAFMGAEMNQNKEHLDAIKNLNIQNIFYTMQELKDFLLLYQK